MWFFFFSLLLNPTHLSSLCCHKRHMSVTFFDTWVTSYRDSSAPLIKRHHLSSPSAVFPSLDHNEPSVVEWPGSGSHSNFTLRKQTQLDWVCVKLSLTLWLNNCGRETKLENLQRRTLCSLAADFHSAEKRVLNEKCCLSHKLSFLCVCSVSHPCIMYFILVFLILLHYIWARYNKKFINAAKP